MPRRDLPIGPGGVAAELGLSQRPTKTPSRAPASGESRPGGREPRQDPDEPTESRIRREMAVRPLPGRRGDPQGRVRWYHTVRRNGVAANCHAFTIPQRNHDAWASGEPLSSDGARYPDGQPVVPEGANPADHPVRCGSCGTHTVDFLHLRFFAE